MATERDLERARVIRNYGRNCNCCAIGPLSGRGLFTKHLGQGGKNVPLCKECFNRLKGGERMKDMLIAHVKRAHALEAAAISCMTERGWGGDTPRRHGEGMGQLSLED